MLAKIISIEVSWGFSENYCDSSKSRNVRFPMSSMESQQLLGGYIPPENKSGHVSGIRSLKVWCCQVVNRKLLLPSVSNSAFFSVLASLGCLA